MTDLAAASRVPVPTIIDRDAFDGRDVVRAWLDYQDAMGMSRATVKRRATSLRGFARAMAAQGVTILTCQEEHVVAWLRAIKEETTRHAYLTDVRMFYEYAVRRGHVAEVPLHSVGRVSRRQRLPRPVSPSKLAMAIGMADVDTRCMILLGCLAGLRRSEIAGLRMKDVDLHADPPVMWIIGKGDKERCVPIHPVLVPELELRQHRDYLFIGRDGDPLTANTIARRVSEALRRAGLHEATTHQLRHTFASALMKKGARLEVVGDLLGHSDLKTTRIYASIPTDATAKAVNMLDYRTRAGEPDEDYGPPRRRTPRAVGAHGA